MSPALPTEEASLRATIDQVLASKSPKRLLLEIVLRLSKEGRQDVAVSVFESVLWRCDVRDYWILHTVSSCYRMLGRDDASFLLSGMAHQMVPDSSGAFAVCRDMFRFYLDHGRARDAVSLFLSYGKDFPHKPFAAISHMMPLLAEAGIPAEQLLGTLPKTVDPSLRSDRTIYAPSQRDGLRCRWYGDHAIDAVEKLSRPAQRPEIRVSCLTDAEVLIQDNALVVSDAAGNLHGDLSISDYPVMLSKHLKNKIDVADTMFVDEAVLIGDRFSGPPNLSHYILDGMSRLGIYEQAGIDIAKMTVIGGEPKQEFQQAVLNLFGVRKYFSTNQIARLRISRLWVSSNCRQLRHPAHDGAPWALSYLRRKICPASMPSDRKLYLSRNDALSRRVVNETEVLSELQPYGFEVIVTGEMSYAEQIMALSRATHVVSPHGAGLTNIVACAPGTQVLELFHPLYATGAYAAITPALGLQYATLVGQDGQSTAPEFNDPTAVRMDRNAWGLRNIRVEVGHLRKWISDTLS